MSTLALALPPRPRLRAGEAATAAPAASGEFSYAFSHDGLLVGREGRAALALLPKADQVVVVIDARDVSWHRITCPKAPPARLSAALAGVLEDVVLEDAAQLHFALEPGARGGQPAWVAATDRARLFAEIAALERGGLRIDRVVPAAWPDEPPIGHFSESQEHGAAGSTGLGVALTWSHAAGVATWPLQGGLARSLLPSALPPETRFTATASVAAPAERWLGASVRVLSPGEHCLQAARSLWNLRQFGLAPRHRGMGALRDGWRRWHGPSWRWARRGLVALVVVQVVGLNLAAWQQRSTLEAKRKSMTSVLLAAHPQVRAVLDAPAQMQRETDALRVAAGRPGEADLEAALQAVASAWPAAQPVQTLGYENGRLTLAAPGWSAQQVALFSDALAPSGWRVEAAEDRLTLSRQPVAVAGQRT